MSRARRATSLTCRRTWEEALELFGELGSPTAEELRLELMAIEPDQSDST